MSAWSFPRLSFGSKVSEGIGASNAKTKWRMPLMLAAAMMAAFVATGCDDHVQITRDPDVRIRKGATWAWAPEPQLAAARDTRDNRRVLSRDNGGRQAPRDMVREDNPNNQVVQDKVRQAIQQSLMAKGMMQSSDPATADFLVDYHFAVDRRSETVQTVYPGAYPGLVCGPYGCYRGWGYGPAAVGYERVHWRAGTIAFNFTQNSSKRLVYQAIGEKPVRRDTFSLTQDEINGLVNHLLKDLKTK